MRISCLIHLHVALYSATFNRISLPLVFAIGLLVLLKTSYHATKYNYRCSVKYVFLEMSRNSQENACARVSFLIKLQALGPLSSNFIKKEALAQVLSCEIYAKFLIKPFLTEHLRWLFLTISRNNKQGQKVDSASTVMRKWNMQYWFFLLVKHAAVTTRSLQ